VFLPVVRGLQQIQPLDCNPSIRTRSSRVTITFSSILRATRGCLRDGFSRSCSLLRHNHTNAGSCGLIRYPHTNVAGLSRSWLKDYFALAGAGRCAAQLLLDQADVAAVSRQIHLALFYDAQLDTGAMDSSGMMERLRHL
jgi:hypothetical protein